MRDLEDAWAAIHDATPSGWFVAKPQRDMTSRQLNVSAILVSGRSRIGHMPKVKPAQAPSEPTALVELARCLVVTSAGGVPK